MTERVAQWLALRAASSSPAPRPATSTGRCAGVLCNAGCQRSASTGSGAATSRRAMHCSICLDNDGPPLPIQGGCGCRAETGCAHVACRVQAAEHQGLGFHEVWFTCTTCKQQCTGAMQLELAEALWEQHRRKPARNYDHLAAQNLLAGRAGAPRRQSSSVSSWRRSGPTSSWRRSRALPVLTMKIRLRSR